LVSYPARKATLFPIGCELLKVDHLQNKLLTSALSVSWVTLPAAVHYVRQRVINSSPDKVLVPCLNKFMRRTTGAQHMFLILIKATKESLQRFDDRTNRSVQPCDTTTIFGRKIAPSADRPEEVEGLPSKARITEARILASVTKALDVALELNC
jgi:hypothetical protein